MVLARKTDDGLTSLVKRLDTLVAEHRSSSFKAIIVFLGANPLELKELAAQFADDAGTTRVPITLAIDLPNGPAHFKLNPEVDYTVIIYDHITVRSNHAVNVGGLTHERIDQIVEDAETMISRM